MKTKLMAIAAPVLLVVAISGAQGRYEDVPRQDIYRGNQQRYAHLEYFGFYASAMGNWNFTAELAPFTNLTWIHVGDASSPQVIPAKIIRRMEEARQAGVKAVVSIEHILFQDATGNPRPDAEIEALLVDFRARIENKGLLDTLAMIYPMDEPFREFRRARNPNFIEQYITGEVYAEIHADLAHVNARVKLIFPDTPIGVILSGHEINHDFFSIPANYDWVGFACYQSLFSGCEDGSSFVRQYRRLLDHMQPHQRLMAVPEAWSRPQGLELDYWPDILNKRFRQHYELALSEPRFIAFIPFIWSFDVDKEPAGGGLNRFPEHFDDGRDKRGSAFLRRVMSIGRQVKNRKLNYPDIPYAQTEPHAQRPPSNIRAGIIEISAKGLLSAWAINDALAHKNLRVRLVLRNPGGKVIHKSRRERTFIRDDDLAGSDFIGRSFVGHHGYRYQIPHRILNRFKGQPLTIELHVFADGSPARKGQVIRQEFVYAPRVH